MIVRVWKCLRDGLIREPLCTCVRVQGQGRTRRSCWNQVKDAGSLAFQWVFIAVAPTLKSVLGVLQFCCGRWEILVLWYSVYGNTRTSSAPRTKAFSFPCYRPKEEWQPNVPSARSSAGRGAVATSPLLYPGPLAAVCEGWQRLHWDRALLPCFLPRDLFFIWEAKSQVAHACCQWLQRNHNQSPQLLHAC